MKCPLCNVEARIDHTAYVENEGQLKKKFFYRCRTKTCPNSKKIFATSYGDPIKVDHDPDMPVVSEE